MFTVTSVDPFFYCIVQTIIAVGGIVSAFGLLLARLCTNSRLVYGMIGVHKVALFFAGLAFILQALFVSNIESVIRCRVPDSCAACYTQTAPHGSRSYFLQLARCCCQASVSHSWQRYVDGMTGWLHCTASLSFLKFAG